MKTFIFLILIIFSTISISAQDLKKEISYDIKVIEDGSIEARRITRIIENGNVLSTSYYRFNGVIEPGGKIPEELPKNIRDGIRTLWTEEVINNFNIKKLESEKRKEK
jgi:acyl-CoA thioesterase